MHCRFLQLLIFSFAFIFFWTFVWRPLAFISCFSSFNIVSSSSLYIKLETEEKKMLCYYSNRNRSVWREIFFFFVNFIVSRFMYWYIYIYICMVVPILTYTYIICTKYVNYCFKIANFFSFHLIMVIRFCFVHLLFSISNSCCHKTL